MWPIKTILNATDFSEVSNEAHEAACMLARQHQARLIVMHVAEQPVITYFEKASELSPEEFQQKLWNTLREPREEEAGLQVEHRIEDGDPVKRIVRAAEENHVDLIVMGASGRTGLFRWLTTSVTDEIVRNSPCSVLLVKPGPVHEAAAASAIEQTAAEPATAERAATEDSSTKAPPPRPRPAAVPQERPMPVGADASMSMT
jgi:nucleotide-binding universal stress UspA family protein